MLARSIKRHKECGGFILPDLENSFTGLIYGHCSKCNARKLLQNDFDVIEEEITLYIIHNTKTNEYLLIDDGDNNKYTIVFESEEQANEFAKDNNLSDYEVVPNVASYGVALTNGQMIKKGGK